MISGVINKGVCMCVCVAEGPSIRPQLCVKTEAEGSAAAVAADSDTGSLGNVVLFMCF